MQRADQDGGNAPTTGGSLPTYVPSGRVRWGRLLVSATIAFPAALACGWLYAALVSPAWHFLLRLGCAAVAAVVVALVSNTLLTRAHSRSPAFNKAAGALFSALVIWIKWTVVLSSSGGLQGWAALAFSSPADQIHVVLAFAGRLHDLLPTHPSAIGLIAGWLAELILTMAFVAALGAMEAKTPYSERKAVWSTRQFEGELLAPSAFADALPAELTGRGVAALLEMHPAADLIGTPAASQWWTVRLTGRAVPDDDEACWLDVDVVEHTREDSGKVKSRRKAVVEAWHVSAASFDHLRQHLTSRTATSEPERSRRGVQPTPVELQPALSAFEAGDYAACQTLALAQRMHPRSEVRADAHRMCALALSRMGNWSDAFNEFHHLFELEPTAHNALQLATTSVMAGELVRGHAWFERALEANGETGELPPAQARTEYLSALTAVSEYNVCMPHLEWLAQAYRSAGITDTHFLWTRGLPFFSVFLEKSLPILLAVLPKPDVANWYRALRPDLDEEGQAAIDAHLAALQR